MSGSDAPPEPDRAEGAPHPRYAPALIGHEGSAAALAAGIADGRMHHAWLICGPPGIGKATLAWQAARRLLSMPAGGPATLVTDPQDPALGQVLALSHQGLFLLRRPWDAKRKTLSTQITVDAVRGLNRFFALSRPDGGRRAVIVDAADDLNVNAANALLKRLEEPPPDTVFLLVCHRPSGLLPTIRSRCRTLVLAGLSQEDTARALLQAVPDLPGDEATALAALSGGSVGTALRMHMHDGLALNRQLRALLAAMPNLDRGDAHRLASDLAARGAEDRRELALQLSAALLASLARHGVTGGTALPDELARLSPSPAAGRLWAETCQTADARVRRGLALNLDPHSLILDMVLHIDRTAQRCVAA